MEEVREVAPISALLRVHDMNYVMKVMKTVAKQVGEKCILSDWCIESQVNSNLFDSS